MIRVRGLELGTLIALPESRPDAVLMIRTPYGAVRHADEADQWTRRGVAVVIQDVRGRHRSSGRFHPCENEGEDGLATLKWVCRQSWCVAPVILYGASYAAHCAVETAIAAARAGLDSVGGVSVAVPALGLGETTRNSDGSFQLESRVGWWLEHGNGRESPEIAIPDGALESLPIVALGSRIEPPITSWSAVLGAVRRDAERAEDVARLRCPLLAIGGIRDWFAQDTIDLWSSWGGPAALVIGPWDHGLRGSDRARQMQSWIAGVVAGEPPTGAHVHGLPAGVRRYARWPPSATRIHLEGGSFRSDPATPFPSLPLGSDLGCVARRSDCLVVDFVHRASIVVGASTVRILAPDNNDQWSASLAIRRRDGRLEQIAHGTSPVSHIRLTPISTHLESGETMAVIISAHSFPRHPRDLQMGDDPLTGTAMRTADRSVTGVIVELPE